MNSTYKAITAPYLILFLLLLLPISYSQFTSVTSKELLYESKDITFLVRATSDQVLINSKEWSYFPIDKKKPQEENITFLQNVFKRDENKICFDKILKEHKYSNYYSEYEYQCLVYEQVPTLNITLINSKQSWTRWTGNLDPILETIVVPSISSLWWLNDSVTNVNTAQDYGLNNHPMLNKSANTSIIYANNSCAENYTNCGFGNMANWQTDKTGTFQNFSNITSFLYFKPLVDEGTGDIFFGVYNVFSMNDFGTKVIRGRVMENTSEHWLPTKYYYLNEWQFVWLYEFQNDTGWFVCMTTTYNESCVVTNGKHQNIIGEWFISTGYITGYFQVAGYWNNTYLNSTERECVYANILKGSRNLTCEILTGGSPCTPSLVNDTPYYDLCNSTNQKQWTINQYDFNNCGGANVSYIGNETCNFCSFSSWYGDWSAYTNTTCGIRSRYYGDAAFSSCCNVTNISTDCLNTDYAGLNATYNETSTLECVTSSITVYTLEEITREIKMIAMVILWLGLWIFGYYAMQTSNDLLGGTMIVLTLPVDFYFSYLFQEVNMLATGFLGIAFSVMMAWTLGVFILIRRTARSQ